MKKTTLSVIVSLIVLALSLTALGATAKGGKSYTRANESFVTEIPCDNCGKTMRYSSASYYDNPCVGDTSVSYRCDYCGATKDVTYPAVPHTTKVTRVPANLTKKTNGSYKENCTACGLMLKSTVIPVPRSISLSTTSYTYNGKQKRPVVTVKYANGKIVPKTSYTYTYSNNIKPGKATVTVKMKNTLNYTGTLTKSYKILPKKASLSKATYKSKGKVAMSWKKDSLASGYVIQYSTSSKFATKNTCTLVVGKNSTTSKSITSLPKRTYYFRVRAYKSVSGTKYKGAWSKAKKVSVKKGVSLKTMINSTKTDLTNRSYIKQMTYNGVDIKKYSSTYSRIKAIYNWHAKNYKKRFSNCMECNMSFNSCVAALYNTKKQYDFFIWLEGDRFKNSNGSVVEHKWSVIYVQGVPYIFDPRMQGYTGNYTGNTYFGVPRNSGIGKRYLHDFWMVYWGDDSKRKEVV